MVSAKIDAGREQRSAPETVASQVTEAALRINAVLPQTQCTKCGYDGCWPYASAIASGDAAINRCPPGGAAGIARLAHLTGQAITTLDPACGLEAPRKLAWIDAQFCIGCTLCIAACPVDAIIGAPKALHAVVPELCTGCELCVAPCPVDCIELRASPSDQLPWDETNALAAKARFEARNARLSRARVSAAADERKRDRVQAAIATAKLRLGKS